MDKEIKKVDTLERTNVRDIKDITVSRFAFVAETRDSVLVKITKQYKIWFNKKWVRVSDYTLNAKIGIVKDFEYQAIDNKGDKVSFDGEVIINHFKKDEIVEEIDKDLE